MLTLAGLPVAMMTAGMLLEIQVPQVMAGREELKRGGCVQSVPSLAARRLSVWGQMLPDQMVQMEMEKVGHLLLYSAQEHRKLPVNCPEKNVWASVVMMVWIVKTEREWEEIQLEQMLLVEKTDTDTVHERRGISLNEKGKMKTMNSIKGYQQ